MQGARMGLRWGLKLVGEEVEEEFLAWSESLRPRYEFVFAVGECQDALGQPYSSHRPHRPRRPRRTPPPSYPTHFAPPLLVAYLFAQLA
jgi:hypothetical protein